MPRLDEQALRRERFDPDGEKIVLGDGQAWTFPRPLFQLTPTIGADGAVVFDNGRMSLGKGFDETYERFLLATGIEELNAMLTLAVELLLRNYALEPADFAELLPFRPGDEANAEMWSLITDIIIGRPKKAMSSGSASPA